MTISATQVGRLGESN